MVISENKFQFHSGLIKSFDPETQDQYGQKFQFHSGLIKSGQKNQYEERIDWMFQFHSGLIKSSSITACCAGYLCVSIPFWSD